MTETLESTGIDVFAMHRIACAHFGPNFSRNNAFNPTIVSPAIATAKLKLEHIDEHRTFSW